MNWIVRCRNRRLGALLGLALCLGAATGAASADYPSKPIRMIVPYPPGGTTDALARVLAAEMGDALKVQVLVDNRGGAGGILGTEAAARSAPDGYTILFGNVGPNAINASLYKKLPYDPGKDFRAVSLVADFPLFLVTHAQVPARTVQELIAYSKSQPQGLSYASVGVGSVSHVTTELFAGMSGARLVHVPLQGRGPAIQDLVAGHVSMMFLAVLDENIKTGRLRLIASSAAKRSSVVPDTPTVAEAGVPGFGVSAWFGVLAPRGTPQPVVDRLGEVIRRSVGAAAVRDRILAIGGEPVGSTAEAFDRLIAEEIPRWSEVVKASGATLD